MGEAISTAPPPIDGGNSAAPPPTGDGISTELSLFEVSVPPTPVGDVTRTLSGSLMGVPPLATSPALGVSRFWGSDGGDSLPPKVLSIDVDVLESSDGPLATAFAFCVAGAACPVDMPSVPPEKPGKAGEV